MPVRRARRPVRGRSKYNARKTTVDNIVFHSAKEARRYQELLLLGRGGEIRNLELQPRYWLVVVGGFVKDIHETLGSYVADFRYEERVSVVGNAGPYQGWRTVIEDVKGFKTPLYRWKKKHVEAQYGIEIREI